MENILKIAKEILDLNPPAILSGSLMLKIRGIDIGREPSDIDIVLNEYAAKFIIPPDYEVTEETVGSGLTSRCIRLNGIKLDILSNNEQFDEINGFRVAKVENLVKEKIRYANQHNDSAEKHKKDLEKMGYDLNSFAEPEYEPIF